MRYKTIVTPFLSILSFAAIYAALSLFCNTQTRGFRPYLILSNLPNDPRFEVPPLSDEEQKRVNKRLDQSFTFLGSGGWCYAFLGEDQTTVLKFYKHTHLNLGTLLKELSLKKLFFISPPWPEGTSYFQEFNFTSCTLLYEKVKERTGLLYVHLNKTEQLLPLVTLIDNIGIKHSIDLDKTEFVVQEKADLILPHIDRLMKEGEINKAKHCIQEIVMCLFEFYKKGIRDEDFSFRNNFGYVEEKAIALDLSSFVWDPTLKERSDYKQPLEQKTKRLEHYLRKYHPELHLYYQECINSLPTQESL